MTQKHELPDRVELWGLYKKLCDLQAKANFEKMRAQDYHAFHADVTNSIIAIRSELNIDPAKHYWAQLPLERDYLPQPMQYTDTEGKEYAHIPDFARQIIPDLPDTQDPA